MSSDIDEDWDEDDWEEDDDEFEEDDYPDDSSFLEDAEDVDISQYLVLSRSLKIVL